ncbi:ESCRT-I complex subunit VPS28 [Entomortierella parvispora]|uniref:Vacuolar protein sorting-associated protein 28 n=1 Tax=Entomortierella parvispora TaxID=205924 RepID=A0A9P3HBL4_9FUNG|nr:ESCRT-I complex subunit VPS28 [Entomortierella parvispora]
MSFNSSAQQYLSTVNGTSSTSAYGSSSSMPAINLDEEIRLTTNNRERAQMDNMADLYSIIVVLEHLELAYIRNAVVHTEYTPACTQLIAQYRAASSLLGDVAPDLERFMKEYNLNCPAAAKRIRIGVPATVEFGDGGRSTESTNGRVSARLVAEVVSHFHTTVDYLRIGMAAVDQLHPSLADLMKSLNNVRSLPADFEGRAKILKWLIKLNGMGASDELSAEDRRQMEFDMESTFASFMNWLESS